MRVFYDGVAVTLAGFDKVDFFDSSRVAVRFREGRIDVVGRGLYIDCYGDEEVTVKGEVERLEVASRV